MSHPILASHLAAFTTALSQTLETPLLDPSSPTATTVVRDGLITCIITATELHDAVHAFREEAQGEIGLHAALEEGRMEEEVCEALRGFVVAGKKGLEGLQAVGRMGREGEVVRGGLEELLGRGVGE